MKKLSFSLFAVLAIAFAISSAFTTKSKTFVPNKWERFGVTVNAVSSSSPSASTVNSNKINDAFKLVKVTSMTDIDAEIAAFNTGVPQVTCPTDNSHVCAAIITYHDDTSHELSLVDYNTGDYRLQ